LAPIGQIGSEPRRCIFKASCRAAAEIEVCGRFEVAKGLIAQRQDLAFPVPRRNRSISPSTALAVAFPRCLGVSDIKVDRKALQYVQGAIGSNVANDATL
jgi:hypothetical protein